MTSQEKKIRLKQYTQLDKNINRKLGELERIKAMCTRMTTAFSDLPKSPGMKSREDLYIKLVDIADEINADIDRYVDMRSGVIETINTVEDDTLRRLLMYKYVDGYTWAEIATEMNYDISWITRLHGRALGKIRM